MQFVCSDHGPQPLVGVSARCKATLNKSLAVGASFGWAVCGVANARDTNWYRCALRLAAHPNPRRANSRGLIQRRLDAAPQQVIPAEWVCLVVVRGTERVSWHLLDVEAVAAAGLDPHQGPLTLYDRDRAAQQLNDRLLIQALIPSQPSRTMCRACLMQAVVPADAPHLRLPLGLWWPHPGLAGA